MKRAIPDPVIVPLVGGKATPAPTIASAATPTDLRQLKVDEFLQARSLQPKSEQAYRRDLQCFMNWTQQAWGKVTRRQVAQFKQSRSGATLRVGESFGELR